MNRRIVLALLAAAAVLAAAVGIAASNDSLPPPPDLAADTVRFGVNQARSDPRGYVFDLEQVRTYSIRIDDAEFKRLQANPRAEQYVRASIRLGDQLWDNIGLRYKGFFGILFTCFDERGNQLCPKLAYKVKFNEYEPRQRFYGMKRLNFHPMKDDTAQMREVLSYELFREFGVAAPRSVYARLELNGKPLGLFTLTEDIDDRFTADRFTDGGAGLLYKEVWPTSSRTALDVAELEGRVGVNAAAASSAGPANAAPTNIRLPDSLAEAVARNPNNLPATGFLNFAADLLAHEDDPAARLAALERNLADLDAFWRYLAVDRLIDNWDGIVAFYCVPECQNHNYFWYQNSRNGRFTLIPWDLEQSWRDPSPIRTYFDMPDWDDLHRSCRTRKVFWNLDAVAPFCDPLIGAAVRAGWDEYIAASRALLERLYPLERLHQRIDELAALIEPHVRSDEYGPGEREWRRGVELLHSEIEARFIYIADKIAAWDARRGEADDDA